jgi:hypothetical protein
LNHIYCFLYSLSIVSLAFVLSVGILLNILSCALWGVWWPIFVVVAYILAPLPNLVCARCAAGLDDSYQRAFFDAGYFLTGLLITSGFALPAVLAHLEIMSTSALVMALAGGLIVYSVLLLYIHYFHGKQEEF